ncbi:MAG: ABC transporter substrate-binding protein [Lachnospiraceae bacterium]|nr:ABC transporter substrate-binding protein [Lachnospiraceae bacterium]
MKKTMKHVIALMLVLVLTIGCFAGCGGNGGDGGNASSGKPENIKIALVGPMTGDNAHYGQQFHAGLDMAVKAYNEKGGTQVTVDEYDDKNDAKEAASIANKIIADGGYAAVIGPFSTTCAFAMAEVLDEENIITISPSCSHADYVKLYDYTFRLSHVNVYEGKVAADYMKDKFGSKKVAAIYSDNDWGIAVDEGFVNAATDDGLEVVANESFIIGQTKDFSASLTKIKQAGADSVYYMGQYTECGMVLKQIRDLDMDIDVIITTSSYTQDSLKLAGDAAQDVVFMTAFYRDPANTRLNEFADKAAADYDATIDNFILRAYDATNWLLDAFDKCESTDPDTLFKAIVEVGEAGIDGIGGSFTLNSERNVERNFFFMEWNGDLNDPQFVQIAE